MSNLKLYLITQVENHSYDTYDGAVVTAYSEEGARNTHPDGDGKSLNDDLRESWVTDPSLVQCTYLGLAAPNRLGLVLASFHNS